MAAYRNYDVVHALCNAHHLLTGQDWPVALAELLVEAHVAVKVAKPTARPRLPCAGWPVSAAAATPSSPTANL